jgi:lysozyme
MSRTINEAGLTLIKSFEGCELTAYQDSVGVWTLGWGHTKGVQKGDTCTQQQADDWLAGEIATEYAPGVWQAVTVPLTDNQFAALVSFAYNLGVGALKGSTLLKKLNARDYTGAADEFLKWNRANKKPLAGLTRRRKAERELFLTV